MARHVEELVQERNSALIRMDINYLRRSMPGTTDLVRIIAAHKIRYEQVDLPREIRVQSGEWLRERGYHRAYGRALLPQGQLPGDADQC